MSALWLPCTQMQHLADQPPLAIVRAQGSTLYDAEGNGYLDMISSWWVNLHGHCHPTINAKISEQLATLEHTLLAGVVHPPIVELAERLVAMTPAPLQKVFFADSGSAAVEVALKMALQFCQQQGQTAKTKFIALEHGYHGETLGSLSVTDVALFRAQYQPLVIEQLTTPSPANLFAPPDIAQSEYEAQCLAHLKATLAAEHTRICALIVEPLVQGAAGMAMYSLDFLAAAVACCRHYGVLVIFDEIAVGFGRTGTMFVCQALQARDATLCPDFLCLSKGLTAGYLPMSCVLTTQAIYDGFYDVRLERGFLHSHSFTGNPLAATAALASLDIFAQDDVLTRNQALIARMAQGLQALARQYPDRVALTRQTGMIAAFSLMTDKQNTDAQAARALARYCLQHGVLIRPIGAQVYLMPPYSTTLAELDTVFGVLLDALAALDISHLPPMDTVHLA